MLPKSVGILYNMLNWITQHSFYTRSTVDQLSGINFLREEDAFVRLM